VDLIIGKPFQVSEILEAVNHCINTHEEGMTSCHPLV
jgi:hypothetical protein